MLHWLIERFWSLVTLRRAEGDPAPLPLTPFDMLPDPRHLMLEDRRKDRARRAWAFVRWSRELVERRFGDDPDATPHPVGALRPFLDRSDLYEFVNSDDRIEAFRRGRVSGEPAWFRADRYDSGEFIVRWVHIPSTHHRAGVARSIYLDVGRLLAARGMVLMPDRELTPFGVALWNSLGRDCPGLFQRGFGWAAWAMWKLPRLAHESPWGDVSIPGSGALASEHEGKT
jgi:hypothetical protein